MSICRYGLIGGTVQGVGFRDYVQRAASRAGLTGFARNLPDGRVEVLLCGDLHTVDAVQSEVSKGPAMARVNSVAWQDQPYVEHEGFETG